MFNFNLPHTNGVEFFRIKEKSMSNKDVYFECMNHLRLLLGHDDFRKYVIGYYINGIKNEDGNCSLRLTYFTLNPDITNKLIADFVFEHSDIYIFNSNETSKPGNDLTVMELQNRPFYTFLCLNTRICMDIVKDSENVDYVSEQIMGYINFDYRNRKKPEDRLKDMFIELSPFFEREILGTKLEDLYWESIAKDFGVGKGLGLHFMANFFYEQEDRSIYENTNTIK